MPRQQSGVPMAPSAFGTDLSPPRKGHGSLFAELHRTSRITGARDGVWRLVDAFVDLASAELTLASVLDRIVEVARAMVDAEYAAVGVIAEGAGQREFVHMGMDATAVERIGELPEGHGILGLLVREPEALLLEDLLQHPAPVGFPAHHPPLMSFLGVPIRVRDTVYGNLYLSDSREGRGFTGEDVELVTALAGAGVAIGYAAASSPRRPRSTVTFLRAGGPRRQTSPQLTEPMNRSPTWTASARRCASP